MAFLSAPLIVGGLSLGLGAPTLVKQFKSFSDDNFGTDLQGHDARSRALLNAMGRVSQDQSAASIEEAIGQMGAERALDTLPGDFDTLGAMDPEDDMFMRQFAARHADSLREAGQVHIPGYAQVAASLGRNIS